MIGLRKRVKLKKLCLKVLLLVCRLDSAETVITLVTVPAHKISLHCPFSNVVDLCKRSNVDLRHKLASSASRVDMYGHKSQQCRAADSHLKSHCVACQETIALGIRILGGVGHPRRLAAAANLASIRQSRRRKRPCSTPCLYLVESAALLLQR